MSTNPEVPQEIIDVYNCAQAEVINRYGDRLQAVYLIGSLAHGGFSESTSDIDVAFILDQPEITDEDWQAFAETEKEVKTSPLKYGDRLSIFWSTRKILEETVTSGAFPVPTRDHGVFPPYDVLDLIQNGVLIHGDDVRESFREPNQDDLYTAGVEFLLSYVNTPENNAAVTDFEVFDSLSSHDRSKLILFPVRLMYSLQTGSVNDNNEAAQDYLQGLAATWATVGLREQDENTYALINQALQIRESASFDPLVMKTNFAGLQDLYQKLITKHADKMADLGRDDYVAELEGWRKKLTTAN